MHLLSCFFLVSFPPAFIAALIIAPYTDVLTASAYKLFAMPFDLPSSTPEWDFPPLESHIQSLEGRVGAPCGRWS